MDEGLTSVTAIGSLLALELHAQTVGEGLHRMLGGRVLGLQDHGALGEDAAHIDDRAAAMAQMIRRDHRAVDDAPVVHLEELPLILDRDLGDVAIEGHGGVVHPGVEAAEGVDGRAGDPFQILAPADIRGNSDRVCTAAAEFLGDAAQGLLIARDENQSFHPPRAERMRRREADAAGCAGDHDHLFLDRLLPNRHGTLLPIPQVFTKRGST